MAHLRAVDNRTRFLDIAQLGQRKGAADDVLGDIFDCRPGNRIKVEVFVATRQLGFFQRTIWCLFGRLTSSMDRLLESLGDTINGALTATSQDSFQLLGDDAAQLRDGPAHGSDKVRIGFRMCLLLKKEASEDSGLFSVIAEDAPPSAQDDFATQFSVETQHLHADLKTHGESMVMAGIDDPVGLEEVRKIFDEDRCDIHPERFRPAVKFIQIKRVLP
jgi:hypothetical protein